MKISKFEPKMLDHLLHLLALPPIVRERPLENKVPICCFLEDHISEDHQVAMESNEQAIVLSHSGVMPWPVFVPALCGRAACARNGAPKEHWQMLVTVNKRRSVLQALFACHVVLLSQSN